MSLSNLIKNQLAVGEIASGRQRSFNRLIREEPTGVRANSRDYYSPVVNVLLARSRWRWPGHERREFRGEPAKSVALQRAGRLRSHGSNYTIHDDRRGTIDDQDGGTSNEHRGESTGKLLPSAGWLADRSLCYLPSYHRQKFRGGEPLAGAPRTLRDC